MRPSGEPCAGLSGLRHRDRAGLLACPVCRRLVHADRLKELAEVAEQAERVGDRAGALAAWKQTLELLPEGTRQHEAIAARVARTEAVPVSVPVSATPTTRAATDQDHEHDQDQATGWSGRAGLAGVGTIGLILWKFKFLTFLILTKAKFLLLGLTKASTFLSMFASLGVYWTAFGWRFALGMVLSIYVHEMGHVAALMRYGVHADAPLFIPGLGALIRLRQEMHDSRQDARVGLAGPLWGLGAALTSLAIGGALDAPVCLAIARWGAFINLFNLIPLWQLDGGRAFRALGRSGRWFAVLSIAVAWSLSAEPLLVLLLIGGVVRNLGDTSAAPGRSDPLVLGQYVTLIAVLTTLAELPVKLP